MEILDYSNILERFCELSKLTSEEVKTYEPTVKSALAYFLRLLNKQPDSDEKPLCEYACGCKAFLEYTVLRAASEKTYSAQTGGIFAKVSEDEKVKSAERLYKNSLAALTPGLVKDDGFVFEFTGC